LEKLLQNVVRRTAARGFAGAVGRGRAIRGRRSGRRTASTARSPWTARAAGATRTAVRERRLEDALQFGGLIAGQLAAGDLAGDQVIDLRLQFAGDGRVPLVWSLARLDCSEESMSVSAEDSATDRTS